MYCSTTVLSARKQNVDPSEVDLAKSGESPDSKEVKVWVVVKINRGDAGRQNVDDADGDQKAVDEVVLVVRTEGEGRIGTLGGEKGRVA